MKCEREGKVIIIRKPEGQAELLLKSGGVLSHSAFTAAIVTVYQLVGNEERLKNLK